MPRDEAVPEGAPLPEASVVAECVGEPVPEADGSAVPECVGVVVDVDELVGELERLACVLTEGAADAEATVPQLRPRYS